jgi:hypothetical protein
MPWRTMRLTLLSLVACSAFQSAANASDADEQNPVNAVHTVQTNEDSAARSTILMGFVGALLPEQRAELQQLLEGELSRLEPRRALAVTELGAAARHWLASARQDPRAFLIVLLDSHEAGNWRLFLIDAARDRAIARQLPSEAAGNSAALETVVSVVSSAVRALDEGLEIASRPTAEVTGEPAPAAALPRESPSTRMVEMDHPGHLALGLGSALSTLEHQAPLTPGLYASAGLVSASGLSLRATVLRTWPARFESEFGVFELQRTRGALAVGAGVTESAWQFSIEAGPAFELLQRRVREAGPGARSSDDSNFMRLGGALSLSTRYGISKRFALALTFDGAYFPQQVRYTLLPEADRVLAAPWRATFTVQLGLEFWLSK